MSDSVVLCASPDFLCVTKRILRTYTENHREPQREEEFKNSFDLVMEEVTPDETLVREVSEEVPAVKFANMLKEIVMDYINFTFEKTVKNSG